MESRVRLGFSSLKRVACRIPTSATLALRGSYGRGTPNAGSDLDVLTVERSLTEGWDQMWVTEGLAERRVSRVSYYLGFSTAVVEQPLCWQALDCIRFVAGDSRCYNMFLKTIVRALKSYSLYQVLKMYKTELESLRLCGLSSAGLRDLKRGPGGQIEMEIASVLFRWQIARGLRLNTRQLQMSAALLEHQRHHSLLKEYVREIAMTDTDSRTVLLDQSIDKQPWYFSSDVSDELSLETHELAMTVLGSVTSSRSQRRKAGKS
jgi:nucleotidyltransferase-like protein